MNHIIPKEQYNSLVHDATDDEKQRVLRKFIDSLTNEPNN
jgi:hypothetical protein